MFHIIDDIPEVLATLKGLIESAGYEAMPFDSAESYLEYLNSAAFVAPVAILTDFDMPGLNGLELVKKVREKLPLQKAVIVSGTPSPELDRATHAHLCDLLSKPYRPEELFSLLEMLVKCDQARRSDKDTFQTRCKHGLEHECPFYPDKSQK